MRHSLTRTLAITMLAGAVASTAGPALASELGTVVSATPAYVQRLVPQTQCAAVEQTVRQAPSGAGGLVGALVGGGLGSAFGGGAGHVAATGLGLLAGALIGNRVEADNAPTTVVSTPQCQTVNRVDTTLVGYDVVYDYQSVRYSARVLNQPGPAIALNLAQAANGALVPQPADVVPLAVPSGPVAEATAPVFVGSAPVVYATAAPLVAVAPVAVVPQVGMVIGGGWGYRRWH